MSEWIIIGGLFMLAVFVFIAMHLTERDSITLAHAINILNCGEIPDMYYDSKTNECIYAYCSVFTKEEQKEGYCRHKGLNITEEWLYSTAEKGDLA